MPLLQFIFRETGILRWERHSTRFKLAYVSNYVVNTFISRWSGRVHALFSLEHLFTMRCSHGTFAGCRFERCFPLSVLITRKHIRLQHMFAPCAHEPVHSLHGEPLGRAQKSLAPVQTAGLSWRWLKLSLRVAESQWHHPWNLSWAYLCYIFIFCLIGTNNCMVQNCAILCPSCCALAKVVGYGIHLGIKSFIETEEPLVLQREDTWRQLHSWLI